METKGCIYKSLDLDYTDNMMDVGGVVCQRSWKSIKPYLEKACALTDNEKLIGIVADDYGIVFKIKQK